MPSFLDFMERASSGPILSENDFNLKVLIPNVRKVTREFGIQYNGENPVPADDEFADRLFEAAVEFVARTGVYCDATNRLIRLERDEILQAVQDFRGDSVFGEGRERRRFPARKPGDPRPPWCHVGTDVHNIGKNIVSTVLGIHGFRVVDIGVNNASLDIIQEAQKARADIIALSSLMTTTMPAQREVIEVLKEMNLRDRFFVMVGGGPVTQAWAEEIGADGHGNSAIQAVETAKGLMARKG